MTFSGISRKVQRSAVRILPGEGVGIETSVSCRVFGLPTEDKRL